MKKTINNSYNLPERDDKIKIADLNDNTERIDIKISTLEASINGKADLHSPKFSGEPMVHIPETDNKYEKIITESILNKTLEVEILQ